MNYWRNGNKREEVKKMNKIILLGNMTREPKTTRKKNEDGSEIIIQLRKEIRFMDLASLQKK